MPPIQSFRLGTNTTETELLNSLRSAFRAVNAWENFRCAATLKPSVTISRCLPQIFRSDAKRFCWAQFIRVEAARNAPLIVLPSGDRPLNDCRRRHNRFGLGGGQIAMESRPAPQPTMRKARPARGTGNAEENKTDKLDRGRGMDPAYRVTPTLTQWRVIPQPGLSVKQFTPTSRARTAGQVTVRD